MPTIQSLGLSGLPLDSLLTSLRDNENNALVAIQQRQTEATQKLSAYGQLKSAVSSFQKAAEALGDAKAFGTLAVNTSGEGLSATASNEAVPGQYEVQIDQLAKAQTLVFAGQATRDGAIGSDGTLSITIDGTEHTLDLTGRDTSLQGIMQAINDDADLGVNATLINDGSDTPYRLMFTSRDTGTDAAVTRIEVSDNAALASVLDFDAAQPENHPGVIEQAAQNAQIQINGIAIEAQSNTIEGAIDGVTLTLAEETTSPIRLDLTRDDSAAQKLVTDFVSAYNSLQDTISSLTSYDVDAQKSSALTGDSVARSAQTRIRGALTSAFAPGYDMSLGQMGVTTDPQTGHLQIDDDKLSAALADQTDAVKALFTSGTGISATLKTITNSITGAGGIIATTTDSLNRSIQDIRRQYQDASDRIDQRMETYRQQFTQLDALVSQMNSLSGYLTQQFSALNNINNQGK